MTSFPRGRGGRRPYSGLPLNLLPMSSAKKMECVTPIVQEKSWSSGTLGNDILRIYQDSDSSDVRLNTKGKSFTAHRLILGARSSVFRAMFEKDKMSESRTGVVNIEDVDSKTMERLLVFLYSDSTGDILWKEALDLYYAADKYAVEPLKIKCRDILQAGLNVSNVCKVLMFADKHSDEQLLMYAKNFVFDHDQVVSTAEWESLEESHLRFTSKIIKEMYMHQQSKLRMEISVKMITQELLKFEVKATDTILDLKNKIQEKEGIPTFQQRLIFDSKTLEDDRTLSYYNITHFTEIFLVLCLRGGKTEECEETENSQNHHS